MAIILSYPIMLYELRHIVDLLAFGERKQTASQNTATTRCADTARMLLEARRWWGGSLGVV